MKKNVGTIDQSIRLVLAIGLIILSLAGWLSGLLEIVALIVAVLLVVTALVRFCPLYFPFGFNNWEKKINVKYCEFCL